PRALECELAQLVLDQIARRGREIQLGKAVAELRAGVEAVPARVDDRSRRYETIRSAQGRKLELLRGRAAGRGYQGKDNEPASHDGALIRRIVIRAPPTMID